jgi:hypothetical protein
MQGTTHLRPLIGLGVLALVLCTTPLRDAAALPTGVLARWSGDIDARNATGPQFDGTLVDGALAAQAGLIAGAFQFDGILDGTTPLVSTPLILPSQGTIALWVKPGTLTEEIYGIFGTYGRDNGNDRLWLNARGAKGGLGIGPNNLVVNVGSCCADDIVVPSPLLLDTWTHLAVTFDYVNNTYALYINGFIASTSTNPPGPTRQKPTKPLDFGGERSDFNQNFYWEGLIDEVYVFDHVLTASEIEDLATPVVPFTGFFPPLSNPPVLNVVQAGQAIPVKFSLDENRGLAIFAPGYPKSSGVSCDPDESINDVQPTDTAGGSGLTYDPTTDEYTYVWKTDRKWRNTCRTLLMPLTDGIPHTADFRFK